MNIIFKYTFLSLCIVNLLENLNAVEFVMERVEIESINDKYLKNVTATVRKYSRRGNAYFNLCGENLHPWTNNVTISIKFQEFLHNEYRPSFIELNYKWCDFLESPFLNLRKAFGLVCPFVPKYYAVNNISIFTGNIPNFPMKRGRVYIIVGLTEKRETFGSGYLYATFK
ncbi:unnamed protein product [Leptosia nina]|uniref:MD-2-related lipid-recognition domain-containing protein n=1 Tax=Leptosia nina TaxID=320188 RepID=A0AAV1JTB0_9NEOP